MSKIDELKAAYEKKKTMIRERLGEFKQVLGMGDDRIFSELAFCLCTPQSKATVCWNAVESINNNRLLFDGNEGEIKPFLNAIRFNRNKTSYIVEARENFPEIKEKLFGAKDNVELRKWLVDNVKGFGYKEAGHFLRNIGLGENLAILDVHILNKLKEFGVIDELPKGMSNKKYLDIEGKMKKFSEKVGIPMEELDLLFWSERTGFIFK